MSQTSHISTSGGLISTAFIENIRQAQTNQRGTQPDTFGLPWQEAPKSPAALEASIAETWEALLERWDAIATELPTMDISQTRDRWILPFLRALDFQPIYQRSDIVLDESEALRFNVSHFGWELGEGENEANHTPPPVHTVPPTAGLDARTTGATNSRSPKSKSPHDMLQLFLNVSRAYRWALLTNGLHLRLLRDYHHTYTKGYVEFDLESIFETRNFADFRALYRMAHASRFVGPAPASELSETSEALEVSDQERWESAPLEMFYRDSQAAGIQVGADLQKQVREAIETLGNGFLLSGGPLLAQLQADTALCQQFYAELLHLVYRILFLLYAEQRGMVPGSGAPLDNLYRQSYSLTTLRSKAESDPASPEAYDLWEGLKVTFKMFRQGAAALGVYRYNGMLFAEDQTPLLDGLPSLSKGDGAGMGVSLRCRNFELLRAIRALTLIEREGVLQRISYADLNVEEIGGIYESLLDFAPRVTTGAEHVEGRDLPPNTFFLDPRGTARKTTGSYYTHPSLVNALIESALVPVLEDRVKTAVGVEGYTASPEGEGLSLNLEALAAEQKAAAEQAILSLKVCDPAMGSGHFLIAANNALALRLAQIRTGDEYPAEQALRRARRDVLAHCIYGVDLNPMAVELCKVALWINAAVNDAPLSFLDHHLKCGNSLIGATPELLEDGIPDDAFQPVTGDDKSVASAVRRRNKQERSGQLSLWRMTMVETEADLQKWRELNQLAEDEPQIAERRYTEYRADPVYRNAKLVADLWTAAFFWPLAEDSDLIPTEELFRQAQADPALVPGRIKAQAAQLAEHNNFFHWHQEFPDVFGENGEGGFDVVVGNPPWDEVRPEEKSFFATIAPRIALIENRSQRQKAINALKSNDPNIWHLWQQHRRDILAATNFLHHSEKYPLSARGNLSTSTLFVDLARQLPKRGGWCGLIVPSGLATNKGTSELFHDLMTSGQLQSLYDFENRRGFFPEVDSRMRFSLVTLAKLTSTEAKAQFGFFLADVSDIRDQSHVFYLSSTDIERVNPNSFTCPVFRTKTSAELVTRIHSENPVIAHTNGEDAAWAVQTSSMFQMSHEANLLYEDPGESNSRIPLFEGKMVSQYNHRAASIVINPQNRARQAQSRETSIAELLDASYLPKPRYWVDVNEVNQKLSGKWEREWLIHFCAVTSPTNERTCIVSISPKTGAGHSLFQVYPDANSLESLGLFANLNSFALDFVLREKMGGINLSHFIFQQLPVIRRTRYTFRLLSFIIPRVLELTYTAWDLRAFADDIWREAGGQGAEVGELRGTSALQAAITRQWEANRDATHGGHAGAQPPEWATTDGAFPHPPFKWDETRRAQLRADLDGLYGHLYGLNREELAYILDTFPIVRRKDEAQYGEYRMKRLVLEAYDKLAGSF